ncbi:hypothetical protein ACFV7Q_05735 [Streptomyces sp. NPDC059851]|uniref:hypothetical protein n=1 Tax=Streptomyces sp. NPDC059851 TaxID=3346971 RepID=UPI00365E2DF9
MPRIENGKTLTSYRPAKPKQYVHIYALFGAAGRNVMATTATTKSTSNPRPHDPHPAVVFGPLRGDGLPGADAYGQAARPGSKARRGRPMADDKIGSWG